jgi:ADP-heptose:LPS heptosyltransferase
MRRLLVDFAGIGDLVMLTPLMRHLAKDGVLELVTRPFGRELFRDQSFVARVHELGKPNVSRGLRVMLYGGERTRLGREVLSRRGFDEIVIFRQERSVIREWIRGWKDGARLVELDLSAGPGGSMVEASGPALASGGYVLDGFDPLPALFVPEEARRRASERLSALGSRVIVIHPGSSHTRRSLGKGPHLKGLAREQWAGLVTRILDGGDADAVVISGSAAERPEARAIRALLPRLEGRVHDLSGGLSLSELIALLSAARALVSIDSGPAHIAAAVGCPLLDVFGPTDPHLYLPKGRAPVEMVLGSAPCQFCEGTPLWKTCNENVCLKSVSVDALFGRWRALQARI